MKQILSIDDEPAMLRVIRDVLVRYGYVLTTTSDPAEGLQILQSEAIDLLLLDVKMPGTSGFDIYEEVRKISKIPVLFVTAYPDAFSSKSSRVRQLWEKHAQDGCTDILYKPFQIESLREKVENLIGLPDAPAEKAP
ncbi:MAG: response regulator [Verrucomicrobia bacterium]|nr:response regulator [Verrucomicrobiota bacterium]